MAKERKPFPLEVPLEERKTLLKYLEDRFGFCPELLDSYLILKGVHNYWLFPQTKDLEALKKLQPEVVGLLFMRRISHYLKPTSAFLQRFGYYATKNIVTLDEEKIQSLLSNRYLEILLPLEPGYVILRDKHWILGCGLYINGKLFSYLETRLIKSLAST
ncbi:MAG: hypothetical protein N2327_03730 [Caldimicrobium sp.]|nr:hypothetical protein [Caldimicrobium sp.]MCX7873528.1 hypothetical protein [Caldimicrobium sp.]MDW8094693.1 hypothetical protein [Caldimicrobium sp.]